MRPRTEVEPAFQRLEMVRRQIERRGVKDRRVLTAMETVPREAFVPLPFRARAYDDAPLPLAHGQTISQPFVVASMIEALDVAENARALEIGTGSGYAAAVLSLLAEHVDSIERLPELGESARRRLERLGYLNVDVHVGDGSLGWPAGAPYDAILVSAGAPVLPRPLTDQLAPGGVLVAPVGASRARQELVRVECGADGHCSERSLGPVRFVPLVGAEGWADDA